MIEIGNWDILEIDEEWILRWRGGDVVICQSRSPIGIAIDAACEFMDRFNAGQTGDPCTLMGWCVSNSWRQK